MKIIASIYKSPKKDEMYLYVEKIQALKKVPEALLELFGQPKLVMDMVLSAEKTLAREDITEVLKNLQTKGWHLQMPPPPEEEDYIQHLPEELLSRGDG